MGDLRGAIPAAVAMFAGTNLDDIVVLTVLFLSARANGRPRPWQIWVGQYFGIGLLVAVSAAAALGLTIVPDRWVGALGLVPLALGVRGLVRAFRSGAEEEDRAPAATGLGSVVAVTIANGGDNISVYTPMFRANGVGASVVTATVFAVLVAVWCLAGSWLGSHPRVVSVIKRFGHWIVPGVFILIGSLIARRFAAVVAMVRVRCRARDLGWELPLVLGHGARDDGVLLPERRASAGSP